MKTHLLLRRLIVSAILTTVIAGTGYWLMQALGNRELPVRQMSFRESRKQVIVAQVSYESREISLSGLGKVVSESAIDLMAEVQGEILRGAVPLKRGQNFSGGQLLFRINDQEARLSHYALKSNFMTLIAGVMPDLRVDFPEAFPKWQSYFEGLSVEAPLPPLPEMSSPKEKVFFTTREIINQYYNLKSGEERLEKYKVRAPFSGSFVDVLQEENSVINPGSRVARIARSNRLELEVPFKTEDLSYIKVGMAMQVRSEDGSLRWPGQVARIGSSLDPATQSINLYISFNPGNAQVFEGQLLRAEVPGSRIKNVMEIPRHAVFNRNQVYVVRDSSRLAIETIVVENVGAENLLFSGLEAGSLVVTQNLLNAYENMPVSILGAPAPETGTASAPVTNAAAAAK